MKERRVAFVTCRSVPSLTPDDQLAIAPLAAHHLTVEPVLWDDTAVRWSVYSAIVIRSCWDYHKRAAEFAAWIEVMEREAFPLWNPPALVRWNMDKQYLAELAGGGIRIPSAMFFARGQDAPPLSQVLSTNGWERAVVKPTISGSAFSTWVTRPEIAGEHEPDFRAMITRGGVVVQRFEPEIVRRGEWSLIFLGDTFSHGVLKQPKAGDFRVQKEHGGTAEPANPSPALMDAARQVLAMVRHPWLYARVDLVESGDDVLLMELEMLEPDLFLRYSRDAPGRFADAIRARALSESQDRVGSVP